MAGKGGAWKVAYADFVTAMMAFFMVMWLITQDQKVKESIARYFQAPTGLRIFDSATKPASAGGMLEADATGPIPGSRLRSTGHGLGDSQDHTDPDNESEIVNQWLFDDSGWIRRWKPLAEEQVRRSQQLHFPGTPDERELRAAEFAQRQLASQLQELIIAEGDALPDGVGKDLYFRAISRVNWDNLAEECIWELSSATEDDGAETPQASE
jgi:flagellar motor protein MotB